MLNGTQKPNRIIMVGCKVGFFSIDYLITTSPFKAYGLPAVILTSTISPIMRELPTKFITLKFSLRSAKIALFF